jgi:hypothetical protein
MGNNQTKTESEKLWDKIKLNSFYEAKGSDIFILYDESVSQQITEDAENELRISDVMCSLPCPFCGSDTEIETRTFGDSMTEYFRVNCKQKGHSLDWWSDSINEATTVWNERQ